MLNLKDENHRPLILGVKAMKWDHAPNNLLKVLKAIHSDLRHLCEAIDDQVVHK